MLSGNSSMRKKYFIILVVSLLLAFFGGLYYFGLHRGFVQNSDDWTYLFKRYMCNVNNEKYVERNFTPYYLAGAIAYHFCGYSYDAPRLLFSVIFFAEVFLTAAAALSSGMNTINESGSNEMKAWIKNICAFIPFFILFMILLHPFGGAEQYGVLENMIASYPSDYHHSAVIGMLIFVIVLQICENTDIKRKKTVYVILGLIFLILFKVSDAIFYISVAAPVLVVLLVMLLRNDKVRPWLLKILALFAGMLALSRIIYLFFDVNILNNLWFEEWVGVYNGRFYGDTAFEAVEELPENIGTYIKAITLLFNCNFTQVPVMGFITIAIFLRGIILIIGFVIIVKIIIDLFLGKNRYKFVDYILAVGVAALSLFYILTDCNYNLHWIRYIWIMVPEFVVILGRNLKNEVCELVSGFKCAAELDVNKIMLIAGVCLCICFVEPVWEYSGYDEYEDGIRQVLAYIDEHDAGGDVVADYWLKYRVSACETSNIICKGWDGESVVDYMIYTEKTGIYCQKDFYLKIIDEFGTFEKVMEVDGIELYKRGGLPD